MSSQPRIFFFVLAYLMIAALAAGCAPQDGVQGELSEGYFEYHCIDESSDIFCYDDYSGPEFPLDVAVGSRFLISFSDDGRDRKVEPGSDFQVEFEGSLSGMVIKTDGPHAFLAYDNRHHVHDLIHVYARDVSSILLTGGCVPQGTGDLVRKVILDVGQSAPLRAFLVDDRENLLAGSVNYQWSSSDETVFDLSNNTVSSHTLIQAKGSGTAQLRVKVDEVNISLEVEVR